ncbi:MAG: GGDEF domain-containing protein [Lachnospiraceae bacterium]|nr:GGDEF domain-containing protein [Lachnospiraceae bacterium]
MNTKSESRIQPTGVLYILAALCIPVLLLLFSTNLFNTPASFEQINLNRNWNVSFRGRLMQNILLNDFDADGVIAGEQANYEIVLPDLDLLAPCVTFKSRMSRVRVFENGEQIYSFGYDIPEGAFVPKTYHYVPLHSGFAGDVLRIEVTAAEDNAFSGAYDVILGNTEDLMRGFVQQRRLALEVGVFMFFFGFCLAVLSPFLILGAAKDRSVFFSALISLLLGVYILCYNDAMLYYTHDAVLSHILEYVSLYFEPGVIMCYIITSGAARRGKKTLCWMMILDLVLAMTAVVLHLTGILMINHMLLLFHGLMVIESIYLAVILIKSDRESVKENQSRVGHSSERVLLFGILLFILSIFLEVLMYYLFFYVIPTDRKGGLDAVTLGALALVMSIMLNYFFHSVDHLTEARTRIKLHGMAFTDSLTGIDNRASCDQFMMSLNMEQDVIYSVVSIDLDGLKIVNDKQGHSIGDMMIAGFGTLLRKAFADCEMVGRMGGDEFLVIKKGSRKIEMEADIHSLKLGAEEENRRGGTFRYAFSYGVADSSEGVDVQSVYMLADERMYRMKDEHHRKNGIKEAGAPAGSRPEGGAHG